MKSNIPPVTTHRRGSRADAQTNHLKCFLWMVTFRHKRCIIQKKYICLDLMISGWV